MYVYYLCVLVWLGFKNVKYGIVIVFKIILYICFYFVYSLCYLSVICIYFVVRC